MVKTLIVDDSEVFRRSIRQLLVSRFEYMHIAEAATVREAMALACASRPDLVFADIRLPDGSGLDLARSFAATLPRVRLCVVTSFDLPEYRTAAQQCGARHYIHKGNATASDFVSVVNALLAHRFAALRVDDDGARRAAAAGSLTRRWPSMIAFEAGDLHAGLGIASAVKPWLVLVRISLIDARCAPLCLAMKSAHDATTLVATGGLIAPSEREWALQAGADHALAWPERGHVQIAPIVKSLLARHRAARRTPA